MRTKTEEIYNINNEQVIREYLGLSKEFYDRYWTTSIKPKLKEVCKIAKEQNAEYIFTGDFETYLRHTKNRYKIIKEIYGITIFKEYKRKEKQQDNA